MVLLVFDYLGLLRVLCLSGCGVGFGLVPSRYSLLVIDVSVFFLLLVTYRVGSTLLCSVGLPCKLT